MRIATLSCGSILIQEKDDKWLFGAPEGILDSINTNGLELPDVIFTTVLKCKGLDELRGSDDHLIFRGRPLRTSNISADVIQKKHGTDYEITSPDARILFSERGDVSSADVEGYDLAIIKNKHRSESMGDNVITWPWSDTEFAFGVDDVRLVHKVFDSLEKAPDNLKKMDDIPLTLDQVNFISRIATASNNPGENFALGISAFKKAYEKKDGKWSRKVTKKDMGMSDKPYNDNMPVRMTKVAVNYKEGNEKKSLVMLCGNCIYWKSVNSCKLIKEDEGDILPNATCDLFELKSVLAYKQDDELGNIISPDRIAENRTLGNILIANLHTAYNDTADQFARDGLVSQNERIDIADAIGPALKTFQTKLDDSIMNRELPTEGAVMVPLPISFKEAYKELPDEVPGDYFHTFKSNGDWMWLSVTSKAIWDKHEQKFSERAMDWAIKFSNLLNIRGPLRFRHIPGLDGGTCLKQARIGEYLIELGKYDHTPLGESMRRLASDGSGKWRMSAGLAYTSKDLKPNGEYNRAIIFERSMTDGPAVYSTTIENLNGGSAMTAITEEDLAKVAAELDLDITVVKALIQKADSSSPIGGDTKLKEAYKTILEAAKVTNPGGANASKRQDIDEDGVDDDDDDDDDDETVIGKGRKTKVTKKDDNFELELKDTIMDLSEEEFLTLKDIMTEVDDMPTTSKLQIQLDDMRELIASQTTALKSVMQLVAVGNQSADVDTNNGNIQEAIKELISNLPKSQSTTLTPTDVNAIHKDEQILASLKALEAKIDAVPTAGNKDGIYDLFTSKAK